MSDDYCTGYIVGATDGDGTMSEGANGKQYRDKQWYWRVAVTYKQTEFIDRLIQCASRFGIHLTTKPFDSGSASQMIKVETRRRANIEKLSKMWGRSGVEFSRGYMAGIFDAEGSFGKSGGRRPTSLRIANTNGPLLESLVEHGHAAGFEFKIENFHGKHCRTARLYGALDEVGHFVGETCPALTYKKEGAFGCRIQGRVPRVVSVEYVGVRDLVDIQTSKRTFIANGYLAHNCYAETFAERFRGVPGHPYEFGFDLRLVPHKLTEPLRWKTPRMIFVNSMSDLFHEGVPSSYIGEVFDVMRRAHWHEFQVLTKRSKRLRELDPLLDWPPNVWMGVSVETQQYLCRIDDLRRTCARTKFLSLEPLLGPLGNLKLTGIDWVIVGGESGPGARPMLRKWATDILRQCRKAGVPFFFKQWGGVNKKRAGRELNRRTYDEMPTTLKIGTMATP